MNQRPAGPGGLSVRTCIGEKRAALIRQHRKMSASIEQFHAELTFKIGQRLAHDGLRAT